MLSTSPTNRSIRGNSGNRHLSSLSAAISIAVIFQTIFVVSLHWIAHVAGVKVTIYFQSTKHTCFVSLLFFFHRLPYNIVTQGEKFNIWGKFFQKGSSQLFLSLLYVPIQIKSLKFFPGILLSILYHLS